MANEEFYVGTVYTDPDFEPDHFPNGTKQTGELVVVRITSRETGGVDSSAHMIRPDGEDYLAIAGTRYITSGCTPLRRLSQEELVDWSTALEARIIQRSGFANHFTNEVRNNYNARPIIVRE